MTRLIERNTTIPTRKSQIFSTASDNQETVEVHVLQGEREMAVDNKTIGRFQLTGIRPRRGIPRSKSLSISTRTDPRGVRGGQGHGQGAVDSHPGVQRTHGAEIKRMVQDAQSHAADDRQRRELVDARNEADARGHSVRKSLDGLKADADPAAVQESRPSCARWRRWRAATTRP